MVQGVNEGIEGKDKEIEGGETAAPHSLTLFCDRQRLGTFLNALQFVRNKKDHIHQHIE